MYLKQNREDGKLATVKLTQYTSRREQVLKTGGGLFSMHFPKFPQGNVKLNQNWFHQTEKEQRRNKLWFPSLKMRS